MAGGTVHCDLLLAYGQGIVGALDVNEFVQEDIIVSVRVALALAMVLAMRAVTSPLANLTSYI